LNAEVDAVRTHVAESDVVEKGVSYLFARGAGFVLPKEEVGYGGGDGGVLEDVIDDGALLDPGRDEYGGNANAEAVEVEGVGVVRLDEAVVGKSVGLASVGGISKGAEKTGLVLEEVDYLHGGAGFIEVEEFDGVIGARRRS